MDEGEQEETQSKPATESEVVITEENEIVIIQEMEPSEPVNPTEAALAAMGEIKMYKRGDLVEGAIVQVTDDSLIVDIGTKTEGIVRRDEIGIGPNPDLAEFSVGDKISAVVINEDEEGTYHLSKRRADQTLVWEKVERSSKAGERIVATGFRAVKGGLLVDIGAIAFLPQSLIDIRRIDDLEQFVGQKLDVKVVDYDRDAKPHPKIVVSRRAILEEDLTSERDRIYDSLESGSVVDGKVIKLTNYGAFVDVGGLQGLLHISEMSLGRIKHPNEVMKEGDTIKVKILKVDKRKKRVSLGRRDLLPNPWEAIGEKYKTGRVVEGIVVRTADFGAFIKLDDYFEGLAHISELVDNKISHAKEVFNPGDKVDVLIMGIDRKNKRIKLSVRRAAESQRKSEVAEFMRSQGDLENVFASQLQAALKDVDIELDGRESVEDQKAEEPVEEPKAAESAAEVEEAAEIPDVEVIEATEETVEEAKEEEAESVPVIAEETPTETEETEPVVAEETPTETEETEPVAEEVKAEEPAEPEPEKTED